VDPVPQLDSADDPFEAYERPRPVHADRPWLVANMVAGLDGSLAWHGRVGALSSEADRSLFVRLRGIADAVVVGAATVRAEGYGPVKLPAERRAERRAAGRSEVPPLVVVSRSLELDWDGPLWADDVAPRPIVMTAASAPEPLLDEARARADLVIAGDERVDLVEGMRVLTRRGMRLVLTEGGPTLLAELVAGGLLDELCLTLTPVFGGDPLTMAHRPRASAQLSSFALDGALQAGDEIYLRYLLRRSPSDDDRSSPGGEQP
jgi:riboflavin biosynthesis pyrimidine reductase